MRRYEVMQAGCRTTLEAEDEVHALVGYFDLLRIPGDDTEIDFKAFEWTKINDHAFLVIDPELELGGSEFWIIEVTNPELLEV